MNTTIMNTFERKQLSKIFMKTIKTIYNRTIKIEFK